MENEFDSLPNDPAMLLSVINMKLRDDYDGDIRRMCDDWGITLRQLTDRMAAAGWEYNETSGRFW